MVSFKLTAANTCKATSQHLAYLPSILSQYQPSLHYLLKTLVSVGSQLLWSLSSRHHTSQGLATSLMDPDRRVLSRTCRWMMERPGHQRQVPILKSSFITISNRYSICALPVGDISEHNPSRQLLSEIWSLLARSYTRYSSPKLVFNAGNQIHSQVTNLKFHVDRSPSSWGSQAYPGKTKFIKLPQCNVCYLPVLCRF